MDERLYRRRLACAKRQAASNSSMPHRQRLYSSCTWILLLWMKEMAGGVAPRKHAEFGEPTFL